MRSSWIALLGLPLLACEPEPLAQPNILLISLDTLRPDHLGAWGDTRGLSPSLDHFASESEVFVKAYSQANETLFSHASMFSGRYPSELGPVTYTFRFPDDTPTLAQVLKIYGYQTAAVLAGGHLRAIFGLDKGFDTYDIPHDWGSFYHTVPAALHWLDNRDEERPFFLFLHTYDTHFRYLKPTPFGHAFTEPGYQGIGLALANNNLGVLSILDDHTYHPNTLQKLFRYDDLRMRGPEARARVAAYLQDPGDSQGAAPLNASDHAYLRAVYAGAVSYEDTFFGFLMAGLQRRHLLENTLILVVSDHGESLGEHGIYNHRFTLTEEDTHVVMMLRPPGGGAGGRVHDDLVGLIDVMPTLLDRVGATAPSGLAGRSLIPAVAGAPTSSQEAIFTEGAFRMVSARSQIGRLTFSGVSSDSPFLADIVSSADLLGPAFEATPPELALQERRRLQQQIVEWRKSLRPPASYNDEMDPQVLRELQERGYWSPQ